MSQHHNINNIIYVLQSNSMNCYNQTRKKQYCYPPVIKHCFAGNLLLISSLKKKKNYQDFSHCHVWLREGNTHDDFWVTHFKNPSLKESSEWFQQRLAWVPRQRCVAFFRTIKHDKTIHGGFLIMEDLQNQWFNTKMFWILDDSGYPHVF